MSVQNLKFSEGTKLATARRIRHDSTKFVPSNMLIFRMSWIVSIVNSMINENAPARFLSFNCR